MTLTLALTLTLTLTRCVHLRRSADATAACDALHRAAAEAEPPAWLLTALRRGLSCAQGWDEVALNLRHLHAAHATAHLAPPPMEVRMVRVRLRARVRFRLRVRVPPYLGFAKRDP